MEMLTGVAFAIIFMALAFDYINGFHDTANAIATVVSTRVLTPKAAITMAAVLNLAGALIGTHVAKTISDGILDMNVLNHSQVIILSALLGAIIWNIITWVFGLPSSSSHALIGGLIGAGLVYGHLYNLLWSDLLKVNSILSKVVLPLFLSPAVGFSAGFLLMFILSWALFKVHPVKIKHIFAKMQILSSALMALSHGTNDAQKSMGIITMTLFSCGAIGTMDVPLWVKIACACMMAMGTASGGWKIIKTMGHKIFKLETVHGFAAETSSAIVIFLASHFGAPISTTHIISSSILGVGATKRLSAVRWGIAGNIVIAWILTIPATAGISAFICASLHLLHLV